MRRKITIYILPHLQSASDIGTVTAKKAAQGFFHHTFVNISVNDAAPCLVMLYSYVMFLEIHFPNKAHYFLATERHIFILLVQLVIGYPNLYIFFSRLLNVRLFQAISCRCVH